MGPVVKGFEKFLDGLTVALLIVLVLLVALQVVFRFIGFPSPWTEEMARFAFVYITFFGSVLALKEGSHIVIEFVVERLPAAWRRAVGLLFNFVVMAFLVLVVLGSVITLRINKDVTAASLPWFKMTYVYISIFVASILMLFYVLKQTWGLIAPEGKKAASVSTTRGEKA